MIGRIAGYAGRSGWHVWKRHPRPGRDRCAGAFGQRSSAANRPAAPGDWQGSRRGPAPTASEQASTSCCTHMRLDPAGTKAAAEGGKNHSSGCAAVAR